MPRQNTLVSWIGHADLLAMGEDLGDAGRELLNSIRVQGRPVDRPGPLKTALARGDFKAVHLLSNYPDVVHQPFLKWLGRPADLHRVELANPTDYSGVFRAADDTLARVTAGFSADDQLCILLSPGTPAMTAVWVLLGKSRYPAVFYQTHRGEMTEATIPYDLIDDFVPEVLRDPDRALVHLTTHRPEELEGFENIVGDSQAIRLAVGRARRAAIRDVSVLVLGESGTGKEMFARAIHSASRRRSGPFVPVNCAAVPQHLLESELFGHTKGAFTDAREARQGRFAEAHGGTLFLDELGECSPDLQTKLLRVLQPPPGGGPCECEYYPVGSSTQRRADVRVVAATNRALPEAVTAGTFREDLYYRLAVITIHLPPLRERRTDIPKIADALLRRVNADFRRNEVNYRDKSLSPSAMEFVKQYRWPGNVRQLHNALLQAAVMAEGDVLQRRDLAAAVTDAPGGTAEDPLQHSLGEGFILEDHLDDIHRRYLERAMSEAGGVKTKAAKLLGIKSYQTLDAQLKRLKVRGWT
jgi:DNA-binding NtrC family response regulator